MLDSKTTRVAKAAFFVPEKKVKVFLNKVL